MSFVAGVKAAFLLELEEGSELSNLCTPNSTEPSHSSGGSIYNKDWIYIERNLKLYETLYPCSPTFKGKVDILFWFHKNWSDWTMKDDAENVIFHAKPLKTCFRHIFIHSANLSAEQDLYYYSWWKLSHYSPGTCNMFYSLFEKEWIRQRYDYLFLMEPDVSPIRSFWLEALYHQTQGKLFWQKGAIPQYSKWIVTQHDYHMNGNAFYRVGDSCFDKILRTARQVYPNVPFDGALHAVLMNKRNHHWMRHYAHLFVYTDFVLNFGDNNFSTESVLRYWPETYLVHGKGRWNSLQQSEENH
eukprot:jgi/Galph1/416/GphlegSOOS_G5263.1